MTNAPAVPPSTDRLALPDEFWRGFVADHWERRPTVIDRCAVESITSVGALFPAVVAAADLVRASGPAHQQPIARSQLRVNIEHAAQMTDLDRHLPDRADGSLAGYVDRMRDQLRGRRFELVCHDIQVHDPITWTRARTFLEGLYAHVGLPADKAEAVLFLRDHDRTSFGVHRDDASVFMFVIAGRKRLLTWPPERFPGRPSTVSTLAYESDRADATVLEAGPGDVLYWPSSHWHVAESDRGLSASVSLGLRLHHRPLVDVVRHAVAQAGAAGGDAVVDTYQLDAGGPQPQAGAMAEPIVDALAALRSTLDSGSLERALRLAWIDRLTGSGFAAVPPRLPPVDIGDDDVVAGSERIVWLPWGLNRVVCSVAGHHVVGPMASGTPTLLARLNDRRPHRVADLVADGGGNGVLVRWFLRELLSCRGIALTPRRGSGWHSPNGAVVRSTQDPERRDDG